MTVPALTNMRVKVVICKKCGDHFTTYEGNFPTLCEKCRKE